MTPRATETPHPPVLPCLGVGAIVLSPDLSRVLLVQRGRAPAQGSWSFPGGRVEPGETAPDACQRELEEETGLRAEPRDLVLVAERILREPRGQLRHHFLILDFWFLAEPGPVAAASDAQDARWVAVSELHTLELTPGAEEAVTRARALATGKKPPGAGFDQR